MPAGDLSQQRCGYPIMLGPIEDDVDRRRSGRVVEAVARAMTEVHNRRPQGLESPDRLDCLDA